MSCDCDSPSVYHASLVKVRKPHKCCECGGNIQPPQQAEKIDALWDGEFSTIYTCVDCVAVRDYLKERYVSDDDESLCCHGEMYEYLWQSDLLWDEDEIEEEASAWVPDYDGSIGVIQGDNHVVGVKVDWLRWQNGRLCLVLPQLAQEAA
jgi:hypothetical protein